MNAGTYIVRHVMPQVYDCTAPASEVSAQGFANRELAVKDFCNTVVLSMALHRGKRCYVVCMLEDYSLRATRMDDERDVITMKRSTYDAEVRGMGTGYWAKQD